MKFTQQWLEDQVTAYSRMISMTDKTQENRSLLSIWEATRTALQAALQVLRLEMKLEVK